MCSSDLGVPASGMAAAVDAEVAAVVIERRARPRRGGVTRRARRGREPGGDMVRDRAVVVRLMTRDARGGLAVEHGVAVTALAGGGAMRARQREQGRIMAIGRARPCGRGVTGHARRGRETRRRVADRCAAVIRHMTRLARQIGRAHV